MFVNSFSTWYRITLPVPLVSWWRARMASMCRCHSAANARYAGSDVRSVPGSRLSHGGRPPSSVSALTYGPGRAMT